MIDILAYLPGRRKTTPSGWVSVNAPCCAHMGERPDRRQRGGIKLNEQGWTWNCFNCGYTASFRLGRVLSFKARRLLGWLNVPPEEIERINLESMKQRNIMGLLEDQQRARDRLADLEFQEIDLPKGLVFVTPEDYPQQWQYLKQRRAPGDYAYMVEPGNHNRPHVIVPFTHHGAIVGYVTRFLDDHRPKYIGETPKDYVFGIDLQDPSWQHVLVMEGIFDALSMSGLAVMHNSISQQQARLIRSLGREITVVPDLDQAGMKLVDRALELGWAVSIPQWEPAIKDVNDAVMRYGRLGALLTIMQGRETNRVKIQLGKKKLAQRLRN